MRMHSLKDWYKENLEQFENAEREQKHASKILAKSDRITEEAQHVVSRNLETTDHQFDVKLNDIEYLRELLETTKRSSDEEVEALKAYRDRVHDASSNLEENALKLCRKCISLRSSTMEEWNLYTHNNITKTRKEIEKSRPLRSYVDTILRKSVDDLNFQFDKCNRAFHQRIDEYKEAKSKLENQHFETLRQANEMIRNIDRLEKAISDKEAYMALARTRFNNRVHRPGIELCRDDVEIQLITEIKEIESSVANLHSVLNEAQKSLQHLQKAQIQLEGEINVKTNSLKIDEVDCMSTRAAMNYHFY
nr:PREDICTED: tektin-4 isoform X2 [Bemisia tabaci]